MQGEDAGGIAYDRMVERALRGVVREALALTARNGLTGGHHFYITFRTDYPGVEVPPAVVAKHPEQMTIVLQNQFWDLVVGEAFFAVTLSFNRVSRRLTIPYAAISAFADPFAKFGLHFAVDGVEAEGEETAPAAGPAEVTALPVSPVPAGTATPSSETEGKDAPGKVVTLDAFRRNK